MMKSTNRLAQLVQNLVEIKRSDGGGGGDGTGVVGPTIPYFKYSDFQRAMNACADPTSVILICAQPADVVPHCVAHTAMMGLSAVLLADLVAARGGGGVTGGELTAGGDRASASRSLLVESSCLLGASSSSMLPNSPQHGERSILDVTSLKHASAYQIVAAVCDCARAGDWLLLPQVSAISLAAWAAIGKVLAACTPGASQRAWSDAAAAAAAASSAITTAVVDPIDALVADMDEHSMSQHFRIITFLTAQSAPLGRTLPPRIAQSISVVDTRGVTRRHEELHALLTSVTPLSLKQLSLVCVGVGDGRDSSVFGGGGGGDGSGGADGPVFPLMRGMSLLPASLPNASLSAATPRRDAASSSPRTRRGPPPSFFIDWPCAAAYANAPVSVFSTDSATTSDFVDATLFALRETLLTSLQEQLGTATKQDTRDARTRRQALEARAARTGQEVSELLQIDELRRVHASTHVGRLERNPAWIFPQIHNWVVACAPVVSLERVPTIAFEQLSIDEVVWLHEGVGDATACLRGTWQLAPVCIKCALPSVRPETTARLSDRLLIEARTLLSIRHPSIIAVYGVCELPADLGAVPGGSAILRPLLAAAAVHERWQNAQEDARPGGDEDGDAAGGGGGVGTASGMRGHTAATPPPTPLTAGAPVKQFALILEPFEMSLEMCLANAFDRNKPWRVEQMLDVGVCILQAMVYLSDFYVHRCISPATVVVCHGSAAAAVSSGSGSGGGGGATSLSSPICCKLSQLASAMPANGRVPPPWLISASTAQIPVRYSAPEALWGHFSPASDIWSFGVTLWSMFLYCRRQPYEGSDCDESAGALAEALAEGAVRLPAPRSDGVPAVVWDAVVAPCLQRRPEARPDARTLIAAIMLLKVRHRASLAHVVPFDHDRM